MQQMARLVLKQIAIDSLIASFLIARQLLEQFSLFRLSHGLNRKLSFVVSWGLVLVVFSLARRDSTRSFHSLWLAVFVGVVTGTHLCFIIMTHGLLILCDFMDFAVMRFILRGVYSLFACFPGLLYEALWSPRVGKRELVYMLPVNLFILYCILYILHS